MEKYIVTYTGKRFSALDPRPAKICLEDIAHSLSMICRFNGHCSFLFSVAQHSMGVVNELRKQVHSPEILLYGLLHDAAEAYICDFPHPVKELFPEYKAMENKIQKAIWKTFNLREPDYEEAAAIKEADRTMLFKEARILMKNMHVENFDLLEPDRDIRYVPPKTVERKFLRLGRQLMNEIIKGRCGDSE